MSFSKSINQLRRRLMGAITKNIGSTYSQPVFDPNKTIEIKKVLIIRPNHRLGNQLLLTPIVSEVINRFPGCKVDLFVKGGVANVVFENFEAVDKIIALPRKPFKDLFIYIKGWVSIKKNHYDMVINGDKNSSSGRLLTQISNATYKVFGDVHDDIQNKYSDYRHISKYPIYNLRRYLTQIGFTNIPEALPVLDIKLNAKEIANGKLILNDIVKNDKKTICIYTNATGNKCYSEDWWHTLYNRLLKAYPNYNIIEMLPIENISKINFKAPTFYSKDIREMGGIINNTAIFIAADNGVMHLASASQTPTVGFFSVTDLNVYMPYGNKSIAINTNTSGINDWMTRIDTVLHS